jgi:outer membrane protein assembly factor BamB
MAFRFGSLAACMLASTLAACGGGGSGNSGTNKPDGSWLTFSPSAPNVTQYQGENVALNVTATSSRTFSTPVNIAIIDTKGVITTEVSISEISQLSYVAALRTSAALPVGTHSTILEVRLCEDAPTICKKPLPGSPWQVPLTVQVKSSAPNLTELSAVEGLGNWSTYQGNAAHTGFVAASFDPKVFSRRWKMPSVANSDSAYSSVAVDGGRAFFVRRTANNRWELVAVSEDTGAVAWKVDMGTLTTVNPPAAANGRVYLTSTGHQDTFLWVYEQATGAKVKQLTMSSQWPDYSAPTVSGTDVYTINGSYGGLSKYSDLTGSFSWNGSASPYAGWSPATDGRFTYSFSTPDNTLVAHDAANGKVAYAIGAPYPYSTYFVAAPVVLTDTQQAIVVAGNLMAFDLTTHTRSWILNTPSTGEPAYGNGTIYVCGPNGQTLEARAPATGNLLWSSPVLGTPCSAIVVTRNLAFVSSAEGTQAVDLATNKVVWTYPQGGKLAISARGVLYIFSDDGALAAVNLR